MQNRAWHERLSNDPALSHFLKIHPEIAPHPAWIASKKYPELKFHANFLVRLCALWRPGNMPGTCKSCDIHYRDVLSHVLCVCSKTETIRDSLWCRLINIGPIELSVYLHEKSDIDLVTCLMSCRPPLDKPDDELTLQFASAVIKELYPLRTVITLEAKYR